MKIAALIDEYGTAGGRRQQSGEPVYQNIKEEMKADALVVVTSGNFCQNGEPAVMDKYRKAELFRAQGADLVLELPVYCTLTTFDTFAFAAVSMLEKLNCVNELVVFTENTEKDIFLRIVQFLFIESKEYQKAVKKCRASGMDFEQAQAAVTEQYIPGAEKILQSEINRKAVEFMKAMKRLYSTMKVCFYDVAKYEKAQSNRADYCPEKELLFSRRLGYQFSQMMESFSDTQRVKYLNETAGGYAPATERLLYTYEESAVEDLDRFAKSLATKERPVDNIKRYLLRAILGIRQVDISICGLYSYALYARALGEYDGSALFDQIKEKSWITFFSAKSNDDRAAENEAAAADDSVAILLEKDQRAGDLYRIISDETLITK